MPTIVARLLLCMGFFAHSLAVARADEAALHQHMDLFGNYELSPGQVLTGGPWEDGQVLFMEATNIADGGVFTRADADSFESVFPPGKSFRVVRDAAGDVTALDWQAGAGSTVRAQRVHPQAREDVSIESGDVTLSGSLFLPVGPGPHPCIVLVHGSGDSDRYMGPWVTFFLQSGVGVFTYDKRGVGLSTGDWRDGSYAALADDAVAAVEYLASRDDVDALVDAIVTAKGYFSE